ncbi:MAG: glycosyltransferase family 4 protein [Phycisphaeraceae bacterium]|nr:glycosyltransferase family 4 protein [Phycisphaeraceae bacterium]
MPSTPNQPAQKTLLVISQVYVPDPASVGQHMHDAAAEMARRGWRVLVLASRRGYDDPSRKYPWRETRDGVIIRRLPFASFGKSSIPIRLLAGMIFVLQCILIGLFVRRLRCVLVSTSPPLAPLAAAFLSYFRRTTVKYWAMDLNPDQMIALGKTTETSIFSRLFNWMNRLILRRSSDVVALDRFMADRLIVKLPASRAKIRVMPPWPHEDHLDVIPHDTNPFRQKHQLQGKFVFMYSGNHSVSHPLTTILEAALKLQSDPRLVFLFVGGGLGKREVEQVIAAHKPTNILSLPYQPLAEIKYSLSAGDVHLVSVGEGIVGICHPCKVYGAMAVGRPILLLGPDPSHVSDIIHQDGIGWQITHGDVDGAVALLTKISRMSESELAAMGSKASRLISDQFSKDVLCGRFADVLERSS